MSAFLFPAVLAPSVKPFGQIGAHTSGFLSAGVIAGVAPVFGFTAIQLGLVGYVSAIFKLSAIASVVWATLFLRESGFKERLAGSAVMVVGALFIAL